MQPGQWDSRSADDRPTGSWAGQPGWGGPPGYQPPDPPPAATGPTVARGRPGLIVFTAFLVELIVIAAAFNQVSSRHLVRRLEPHSVTSFGVRALYSGLTYTWRFTPPHGDNTGGRHIWWGELVLVGGTFLLTVLLGLTVVRGAVTWLRAFVGIWMAVIVATVLARVAASMVANDAPEPGESRWTYAVFDAVHGSTVFAAAVLGLVAALIASIVAVTTRRRVPVAEGATPQAEAAPPPPEMPPPFYGSGSDTTQYAPVGPGPSGPPPYGGSPGYGAGSYYDPGSTPYGNRPYGGDPYGAAHPEPGYPAAQTTSPTATPPTATPPTATPPTATPPTATPPTASPQTAPQREEAEAPAAGDETAAFSLRRDERDGADDSAAAPQATTELPRFEPGGTATRAESPTGEHPTTELPATAAFPLPPDDEDIEHQPDHD